METVITHGHDEGGTDRAPWLKIHPALLQLLSGALILGAAMIAGYFHGSADQDKRAADLDKRVSVLEEQFRTQHQDLSEIKGDVKALLLKASR
jgi:hypothetical protein